MRGISAELQIKQATSEGAIRLVAPLFDQYRVFYQQSSDLEASYKFLYDRWVARESTLFVATDRNKAVGFVHLYPMFLSDVMKRFWILNDLYVIEAARRDGVGRALIQEAERFARETGSGGLNLSTAADNVRAQLLYESEGYVRDLGFIYYNKFLNG